MSVDFAAAAWLPADPSNYHAAMRMNGDISNVVIHVTDGHAKASDTAAMWQQPAHGSSAHFVVGQGGEIIQAVRLKDIAYHAHAANKSSVGIEHCARSVGELGPGDPGLPASPAQLAASAALTAWLCLHIGLAPNRTTIQGHAEIDPVTTHRDCPTAVIDLDAYVAMVMSEYNRLIS